MRIAPRVAARVAFAAIGLALVATGAHVRTARSAPARSRVADITPELWGEGLISTPLDELNTVFSPDGNELYWSIALPDQTGVIVFSRLKNGKWSPPVVAPFSGHYTDWDPFFTPDGQRIIFTSNRPKVGAAPQVAGDYDLWEATRTPDGGWSEAVNLGPPVNTVRNEFYPSIASDGTLYFSSNRDGGQGFDIYRSKFVDGKYGEPETLGPGVNTRFSEVDNYIAPDQSFIIFNSSGRPDDLGRGDLYISYNRDGQWTQAVHLPPAINSPAREYCPIGSPDGRWLYFTSKRWPYDGVAPAALKIADLQKSMARVLNGGGNIYRVPMRAVLAATRPQ